MSRPRIPVLALSFALSTGCGSSGSGGGGGTGGTAATGGSGGLTGGSGGAGGATGGTSATGGASGSGGTSGSSGSGGSAGNPVIEMDTSMGKLSFELDPVNMPVTTANFLAYVDAGFFTNTIIHRVIPDFVIQGGGYSSGLVEKSTNPPINLETSPSIVHDYGVISMARTSDPNSATSQFFVVNAKSGAHSLDGQYAAFGHMLEGGTVLDAISAVPTQNTSGFQDVPVSDVVVKSVVRK